MSKIYLKDEEKAIFSLRSLYQKYGYKQYKMSKFEEYDLYLQNKNFLVSDNIITFTDTDGKLMALKPDVTLSIVKNLTDRDGAVQKVYYNENVYRVSKGTKSFKEIMQVGLECMGNVDDYISYEVLMLAAESLNTVSCDYVIDISDLAIVSHLADKVISSETVKKQILKCISEKNTHELGAIEKREQIDLAQLKQLVSTYGSLENVMPFLQTLDIADEVARFARIISALEQNGYKNKIRIDFSITGDTNYYNGLVFKGFIKGVPSAVLSGGQYDNLMKKMGINENAIGFAVYLDMLERLSDNKNDYDVDTVILYDSSSDIDEVNNAVKLFSANGGTVSAQMSVHKKLRYKQLVKLTKGGVEILENNA